MKAIFISDAHLRKSGDERYLKLMNFFDDIKEGYIHATISPDKKLTKTKLIDDLFIAGDLFDFWFCPPDRINPEFKPAVNKLIELKKAGIRIHLCEGNHDFFMEEYFHDVLGMEVYEEMTDAKLDNLNVLIAHGDTTDKTNTKYMMLRKTLRSRIFYNFQRMIPVSIRWKLAGLASSTSKELTVEDGDAHVKKMSTFALAKFQESYDAVILGHCHVPSVNYYDVAGKDRVFATLGDWISHYSFLYYENNKFSLMYYPS
jgi:UDP-2,3-diacylglucosamine hydrolase